MEHIELILSVTGTALGLLITTVTFIAKFFKSSRAKKAAEQIVQIGNAILPYIEKAESFAGYTGAEKKEYVMTKANQFAIDNKIAFNAEVVSEKVEELVSLTKQVNKRDNNKINVMQVPVAAKSTVVAPKAAANNEAVFGSVKN